MDSKSKFVVRDSGVNMASDYGMDGPGIGLLQEPTQPPVQEIPALFPGDKAAEAWR
jgi:hypothetical protein